MFLHDANKATVVFQITWKMSPRTTGIAQEKAWLSALRNDGTQQPRLMELRWLLIRAAVVINYLPTTQIFLYLGKVLIYLTLFAGGSRWMTLRFKICQHWKKRRGEERFSGLPFYCRLNVNDDDRTAVMSRRPQTVLYVDLKHCRVTVANSLCLVWATVLTAGL